MTVMTNYEALRSDDSPRDFSLGPRISNQMIKDILAIEPEAHEQNEWYEKYGPLRHGLTRWIKRGPNTVAPKLDGKRKEIPGTLQVNQGLGGQEKIDRVFDVPSLAHIFAPFGVNIMGHWRRIRRVYLHTLLPGAVISPHRDLNEYFLTHERWHVFLSKPNPNHVAIYDDVQQSYNYGDVRFFNLYCKHEYKNLDATEPFHLLVFDVKKNEA